MAKDYPLDIENCGGDIYILRSKGHHDPHEFMRAVRAEGYDWPLGFPRHEWHRTVPVRHGWTEENGDGDSIYTIAKPFTRGAYPVTICQEAWGDQSYEAIAEAKNHHSAREAA